MGVICHGQSPDSEMEIKRANNPIFLDKKYLNKIILIQKTFKTYNSKKKFLLSLKNSKESKLFNQLKPKKLINFNRILESKSYQYYSSLISSNKILPFKDLISSNKKLQKKISSIKNNSYDFPFHVLITDNKIYKGHWSLSKNFNGYGQLFEFNQEKNEKNSDSITEGIFEEGSLNGFGRIFLSNEEYLIGEFIFNKLNGLGEYYRNDGSIYRGSFFDGLPQGNGEEIFENQSSFKGFYLAGKKKHGKFLWKNGSYYLGDFYEDLFHGYGVYNWGEDRNYEGNWVKGKMDGLGKLKLKDGSYYDGEFKEGKKWGKGIYVWNKDKYYDGNWKNDKQNGFGLYYKNGKKIKGYWIDGKLMASYNHLKSSDNLLLKMSPYKKNKTLEIKSNLKTDDYDNMLIISGENQKFQTIKPEKEESINQHRKFNHGNKNQVFIPKKIQGKNFLGNAKKNIYFDNI